MRGEADEERLGTAPQGVDQARADRQAAIDRAGSLKSRSRRAPGSASMPPAGVTVIVVEFTVIGDLFHAGKRGQITPDYDRQTTGQLHLSGEDAEVFVTAYAIGDTETQRDLLSLNSWMGEFVWSSAWLP